MGIMKVAVTILDVKLPGGKKVVGVEFGGQSYSKKIARRLAFEFVNHYIVNDDVCEKYCLVLDRFSDVVPESVINLDGKVINKDD